MKYRKKNLIDVVVASRGPEMESLGVDSDKVNSCTNLSIREVPIISCMKITNGVMIGRILNDATSGK